MRTVARSLTVVLSFLALQLSLLGSAWACMNPSESRTDDASMAMSMPVTATDSGDHHCASTAGDSHSPTPAEQHCATMIICAFALDAPTAMTVTLAHSRVISRVHGISERTPMSDGLAPELPPPRA